MYVLYKRCRKLCRVPWATMYRISHILFTKTPTCLKYFTFTLRSPFTWTSTTPRTRSTFTFSSVLSTCKLERESEARLVIYDVRLRPTTYSTNLNGEDSENNGNGESKVKATVDSTPESQLPTLQSSPWHVDFLFNFHLLFLSFYCPSIRLIQKWGYKN